MKNTPIREYNEGMTVEVDVHEGRLVLRAFCEAGFKSTLLDILDILEYLKYEYPHVWGGIPISASQK